MTASEYFQSSIVSLVEQAALTQHGVSASARSHNVLKAREKGHAPEDSLASVPPTGDGFGPA